MTSKTKKLTTPFMVQTIQSAQSISLELYVPYLGGDGVELVYINQLASGFIMGLSNGKRTIEIGQTDDLLPNKLVSQMKSEYGLLLVEVTQDQSEVPHNSRYHLISMEV